MKSLLLIALGATLATIAMRSREPRREIATPELTQLKVFEVFLNDLERYLNALHALREKDQSREKGLDPKYFHGHTEEPPKYLH